MDTTPKYFWGLFWTQQSLYLLQSIENWCWWQSMTMKNQKFSKMSVDFPSNLCQKTLFSALLIYCSEFLTWIGSGHFFYNSSRVSHLWFRFGFGKFTLKSQTSQFFSLRVKKISSGHVKKYLGQRQVSLFFTAGQKYAWVGSGPSSII